MIKLLLLFFVFVIVSCSSHKHVSILPKSANTYLLKGKIEGRDSVTVYLGTYDTTLKGPLTIFDSTRIYNSSFHFSGILPKPLICKLKITELEYGWPYTHYFVLDTGITYVQLFKDSMANSVIQGSTLNEQLVSFNKKYTELAISFGQNFPLNKQGNITDDSFRIIENKFYNDKHNLILGQIQANPTTITSAFIARTILSDEIDLPTFEQIVNALGNGDNFFVRHLSSELAARKQTLIGMPLPKFEIVDNKNRVISNGSLKGKYFLLDFWASWCKPCREESSILVKAYNKYADEGLEMISVSLDHNISDWEKAIEEDGLDWVQACVGPYSKIGKDFAVSFVPSNFLVDPNGKIIAKDLTGADLEKTLDFWLAK